MTMVRLVSFSFVVLWATGFVGARMGMPHGEPASFLSIRFFLAFVILSTIAVIKKSVWPRGRQFVNLLIIGVLIHAIHLGGVFWAVRNDMAGGIAAVIIGLHPLFTGLLGKYWLEERLARFHWYGVVLGLVGLVFALGFRLDSLSIATLGGASLMLAPIIACFISVLGIAFGTVYQKQCGSNVDLISATSVQFMGACIFTFVFALLFENFQIDWNLSSILAMVWLVLVLSIAAIFLLMWLIREGSVAQTSILFYLVPSVSALMTWALFDEQLTLMQIFGFVLCSIAVLLSAGKPVRPERPVREIKE